MTSPLLEINDLKTYFYTEEGVAKAVDGVSYTLGKGMILGLVGESGCGKSVTSLSIMRLIQAPQGRIVNGEIIFNDRNLVDASEDDMRKIRGNQISMIFQEPMTSLNPVFTCGNQIQEAIMLHQKTGKKEAREKTVEMLKLVGIPAPELRVDDYPHQLSGGLRQRVMIAMALSCNPLLLIADEPTTALDVTIQAQILELLERLQNEFKMSVILITHDLGVVAGFADDTAIMYAGEIVEYSDVRNVFKSPLHPYTKGLLKSIPKLNELKKKLFVIPGQVPNPVNYPKGCRFHPRCQYKGDECSESKPELRFMTPDHKVRCFKAEQIN